jgi:integrase
MARGCIRRNKDKRTGQRTKVPSWSLWFEAGPRTVDLATGRVRRQQKRVTFRGTYGAAQKRLTELLAAVDKREYVEPLRLTVAQYLHRWLPAVAEGQAAKTTRIYELAIRKHIVPNIGEIRLQDVTVVDLEDLYATVGTNRPSVALACHNTMSRALRMAEKKGLVPRNVARLVDPKPGRKVNADDIRKNCYTGAELATFLTAAKDEPPQTYALTRVLASTGCRINETLGLFWTDLNLDAGTGLLQRQVLNPSLPNPYGPLKGSKRGGVVKTRKLALSPETVAALRTHRARQREEDFKVGRKVDDPTRLVFSRPDGKPIWGEAVGRYLLYPIMDRAGLRRISSHGFRHTVATLLLSAGRPLAEVCELLGHASQVVTLKYYSHAQPGHQASNAALLDTLAHG